jgi:hypothetical protein
MAAPNAINGTATGQQLTVLYAVGLDSDLDLHLSKTAHSAHQPKQEMMEIRLTPLSNAA